MKRKLILFLVLSIMFCSYSFASNNEEEIYKGEKEHLNQYRPKFNEHLEKMISLDEPDSPCKLYFSEENDSLIIGCSPVTLLWMYGKSEVIKNKYDLIGFGETLDADILYWLRHLNKKKYKRIVIWFGYNDVFDAIDAQKEPSEKFVDDKYFIQLEEVLAEARRHLIDDNSEIVLILLKYAIPGVDLSIDIVNDYNREAWVINNFVAGLKARKELNIKLVSIEDFITVPNNTEWFVHFNNPEIFAELFDRIAKNQE